MKKRALRNGAMALAAVFCLFPTSGWADVDFTFTCGFVCSGNISSGVATLNFNDLTVVSKSGTSNYAGTFTETYSNLTGVLTFSGTGTGAGNPFDNLGLYFLTVQESKNLLGSGLNLNAASIYSGITTATLSSAFLGDLGLASNPTISQLATGTNVSITTSGTGAVTSYVATFDPQTAVPEPSAFAVLGAELFFLLTVGFAARKSFELSQPENKETTVT